MAVINELVTELGFNLKEGSIKKIDEFEKKIRGISSSFEKMGHMFTGGLGIKDFFGGALGRAQDIMNTSRAIGMSTDALQKWQYAAKVTGVSSDSVISDLQNLNANFFMSEKGVLRLADSMKRMSAQAANWWGNRLGLSQDTILLLREGSQAILERQKAAKEAGAITPLEELKKAQKMKMELDAQKERFLKLADAAAYRLLPPLLKIMEKFNEWMGSDPGRAETIIEGITAALLGLTASNVTSGILNLVSTLTPLTGMLTNISKKSITALASIGKFAIASPLKFTAVTAAITAVSMAGKFLYDDFQKFKKDGDSLIPWKKITTSVDKIKNKISEWVSSDTLKTWGKSASEIFNNLIKIFKNVGKWIVSVGKDIKEWLGPEGMAAIKGVLEGMGVAISGVFDLAKGSFDVFWKSVQSLFAGVGMFIDWLANDRTWDGLKERMKSIGSIWDTNKDKKGNKYLPHYQGSVGPAEPIYQKQKTEGLKYHGPLLQSASLDSLTDKINKSVSAEPIKEISNAIDSLPERLLASQPTTADYDIQSIIANMSNKMPTELTLKSTSVRAFAEVMHELNTSQPHSTSSVVKNADFNGATIQIIATGADLPDVLYSLEEMGADTSDSYNGTGFIN